MHSALIARALEVKWLVLISDNELCWHVLASIPGLLPPAINCIATLARLYTQKGGRRPGRFHHVMLAAGDVTSYKQYTLYMPNTILYCFIGRDVTRGKHCVMKSSRPSPSFLRVESKVAIQLIAGGRRPGIEARHVYGLNIL